MKILSPLIFGKKIDSVLKIAVQLSLIYSSMELERNNMIKLRKN